MNEFFFFHFKQLTLNGNNISLDRAILLYINYIMSAMRIRRNSSLKLEVQNNFDNKFNKSNEDPFHATILSF